MNSFFNYTYYRYSDKEGLFFKLKCFLTVPGFRFAILKNWLLNSKKYSPLFFLLSIWFKNIKVKYGYQIPYTTKIGYGLFLPHFGNIVINKQVVIGNNCNIAQGVTIGQINVGVKKGCPEIGNKVWIGANAVVVGKIKIGNDVMIAPLTYVNFDVPDGCLVIGNPAKVIEGYSTLGYINNVLE